VTKSPAGGPWLTQGKRRAIAFAVAGAFIAYVDISRALIVPALYGPNGVWDLFVRPDGGMVVAMLLFLLAGADTALQYLSDSTRDTELNGKSQKREAQEEAFVSHATDNDKQETHVHDGPQAPLDKTETVIAGTRYRAHRSRRVHNLSVVVIISLCLALVTLFLTAGNRGFRDDIMSVVARLGAVAVSIFLIQILFSFARYHMRLADHLEAVADALYLGGGNEVATAAFLRAIAPTRIDFGKSPASPTEQVIEAIRDVAKAGGGTK
jgi:hypothetical protein